jgi:dihydrofolate synthase / folylpolyglutamate synthase
MNYTQTLDYLYTRLPMYQRIGSAAYKANLDNTIAICELLDHPEKKFRSVHVAGTNGKGSSSHMIASVLQSAGLNVGLYTSPHLKDFRERIRINGEMIAEEKVIAFVEKYAADFEKIQPSFFEMTVGMAFAHFAEEKVDIAVIEVGLGGRLDSTNVILPEACLITNISFDHMYLLGNTIEQIAVEKAGIIKPGVPVVIGERQEPSASVFIRRAAQEGSAISFADEEYSIEDDLKCATVRKRKKILFECLESGLLGEYQRKNIPSVLCLLDVLRTKGIEISEAAVRDGIKNVVKKTGLLGRWQTLSVKPLVIADTGHNEAGIGEVLKQLAQIKHERLHFVLGVVNDKDISRILALLPTHAEYYFCRATIPRALAADELARQASEAGLKGGIYHSVPEALNAAKQNAKDNDLVFVGGSTFTVADAL